MSEQSIEETVRPSGVRSPEEIHAETLADPGIPAVQAEVLEEVGPRPTDAVSVAMSNGVEISVPMQSTWRLSAQEYMRAGDFNAWAESVLTEADLGKWDDWIDSDPTIAALTDFFDAVGKATGLAAGGNRASRRLSARTRGR